ncbi:MAG: 50S ribosomal protein L29 [Candidatus Omnitrophica bacterium]|nr:50S ribosomal protein L29 [Candidatus Omnitrophota bacterium]
MLKTSDLRAMNEDELVEKVAQLKKDLMQYRFQSKTGKLETKSTIKAVRKDIARLLTIINEKKENLEVKP